MHWGYPHILPGGINYGSRQQYHSKTNQKHRCKHLDVSYLAQDPRFSSNRARVENRAALEIELSAAFGKTDGEELGPRLLADGVPAAPILNIEAVAHSDHARFRCMVVQTPEYIGPGIPIKLIGTPGSIRRPPPKLGETVVAANDHVFEM